MAKNRKNLSSFVFCMSARDSELETEVAVFRTVTIWFLTLAHILILADPVSSGFLKDRVEESFKHCQHYLVFKFYLLYRF